MEAMTVGYTVLFPVQDAHIPNITTSIPHQLAQLFTTPFDQRSMRRIPVVPTTEGGSNIRLALGENMIDTGRGSRFR